MTKNSITVVGSGYVGMSLSALLSKQNNVTVLDIDKARVDLINKRKSTISDKLIEDYLLDESLNLIATLDNKEAYKNKNFIIVCTPTDYDPNQNKFDSSSVDLVVKHALAENKDALVIIKSTIPIGHTEHLQKLFKTNNIIHSPEFLREGSALYDNLYPSRMIVGGSCEKSIEFANIMKNASKKDDVPCSFMSSTEAESVKLFANTYLAMRVAFFNELDSFAMSKKLSSKNIISGVCADERIGNGYNNPSLGYGGYCLPKDTKQLRYNFRDIPESIISAIVTSNKLRKDFIANEILKNKPNTIGFFRLIMKEGSDNFRSSAIQGIIQRVRHFGADAIIFEPNLSDKTFEGFKVINDIEEFKKRSSIIVTNRDSDYLEDVREKCFSRDIFNEN